MFLKVHQVVFESFSRDLADTSESDTKNMYIKFERRACFSYAQKVFLKDLLSRHLRDIYETFSRLIRVVSKLSRKCLGHSC